MQHITAFLSHLHEFIAAVKEFFVGIKKNQTKSVLYQLIYRCYKYMVVVKSEQKETEEEKNHEFA